MREVFLEHATNPMDFTGITLVTGAAGFKMNFPDFKESIIQLEARYRKEM